MGKLSNILLKTLFFSSVYAENFGVTNCDSHVSTLLVLRIESEILIRDLELRAFWFGLVQYIGD